MDGYDPTTYGERFADVYDDWYRDITDVETTVATLAELSPSGSVLELGVGTGRLAIPLASRDTGRRVTGIDTSAAMLAKLAERDPVGLVDVTRGDMVADLPAGPFTLVLVAFNTLFNLTADGAQAQCFRAVADRLSPGGRFVIEAFVPDDPPRHGDDIAVRTLTADRVVLSVSIHDADGQRADGQFIEITEAGGVTLRPWSIVYSSPSQLDRMATAAGLQLEHRWETFAREPFTEHSARHVSVYLKT